MSEVISFRLDKENPRESKAIEILNAWIEKGFSTRNILTTALYELDRPHSDLEPSRGKRDWDAILDQIGQLVDFVEAIKTKPVANQDLNAEPTVLRESFLISIEQGAKPGIKLE